MDLAAGLSRSFDLQEEGLAGLNPKVQIQAAIGIVSVLELNENGVVSE
jgi:hypothetical protein